MIMRHTKKKNLGILKFKCPAKFTLVLSFCFHVRLSIVLDKVRSFSLFESGLIMSQSFPSLPSSQESLGLSDFSDGEIERLAQECGQMSSDG